LVLATAVSAVCTAACALYTDAWAEARLPGEGVDVVVVVDVELVFAAELPPPDGDDRVVLGTITVTVTLGVVFVTLVPDLVGVVPDLVGVVPDLVGVVPDLVGVVRDPRFVGEVPGVVPGWKAAYSTVWAGAE
jgi:hypothetical protein